jgi:methionyl-tRNA synthetase
VPENFAASLSTYAWIFVLAAVWSLVWKGMALWRAARNRSVTWFVALLVINTLGILDILYIFAFSTKTEVAPPQSLEEQQTPEPEKLVLDIKKDDKIEEEKPNLDEEAPKS